MINQATILEASSAHRPLSFASWRRRAVHAGISPRIFGVLRSSCIEQHQSHGSGDVDIELSGSVFHRHLAGENVTIVSLDHEAAYSSGGWRFGVLPDPRREPIAGAADRPGCAVHRIGRTGRVVADDTAREARRSDPNRINRVEPVVPGHGLVSGQFVPAVRSG